MTADTPASPIWDDVRTGKVFPNEEAKLTAVQIRDLLFQALEAALDDRWSDVREHVHGVDVLAEHCRQIEETYYRAYYQEEEPE